ncbi:TonB-dependent receptor [Massilia violaceinigra]|uniref:TonB-dependent receptor n=1 Tax=Massilia violaceinigra TaxID=2045208 RepID=A0ABY4A2F3_9BURK|nr:outer membrane beta-barrel family protein [Massilia violaceinigra]UOD28906.1 TonB-dependent receptor [Massilia violaceinigra]
MHFNQRRQARATLSIILFGSLALPMAVRADDPAVVTVTGKKEAVVKKLDKTVYDVSTMARAANGSAQDVLQSTPEVSVTADGQIAVKGNTQVTVLVNGKPTAMMAGDERAVALQTMSGTDIASIEVITNPSAAYNANGGAIVNIVLKRNRKAGAHAQMRASAADHGLWNAGASGDITRKDLSVHGNLAYRRDGTQKFRQSAVEWHNPLSGETGSTLQTSEIFVRRKVQSAGVELDYALGDSDSLTLSAKYNERGSLPLLDTLNVTRDAAGQAIFHRISYGPNEQADNSASLAYSHQDSGNALKATLGRSTTTGLIDKSYSDVFVAPLRATGYSRGATRSARHLNQATLDWTRASADGQWGMGIDLQDEVNELDNYQAFVDRSMGVETPDPATTNGYNVATALSAIYLTNQINHGQWEALLGGRLERMALRVSPAQGLMQRSHWQAFNPSLHLKYAASDKTDYTLSYRRSLQRPDPRDLNPFTTYVDAQNLSRGNPGLKPQRLNSWEIGANTELAKVSASATAFYRTSGDTVADARSFADKVLVTSKQNGGQARSLGVTGSLDWTPDAALRFGVDGGAYRVALSTPDLYGQVRQADVVGYMNMRADYSAAADKLSLDAHVQSGAITPLGRHGSTSNVNLSWKRQLSKTLTFTVNASDIFDGSKRTYRTGASTFRQAGFDHFVARRIYLGFVKKLE